MQIDDRTRADDLSRLVAQRSERPGPKDTVYIEIGDIDPVRKQVTLKEKAAVAGAQLARQGDVLVSTIRPGRGAVALAPCQSAVSPAMTVLYGATFADTRFSFHVACRPEFAAHLDRLATGSTYPTCSDRDVLSFPILALSAAQRARVAALLDTMNGLIWRTEAVIAKLKQVRAGLLRDLLTYGLDEHGQLRDSIARPEQFQDSPLGRIPREWGVVRIADCVDIEHGYAFDGSRFTDKPIGPRLLVPGNFHRDGGLYFTEENTKYYAGDFPTETVLANGDILIVMTDLSPMTLILGRTVLLDEPVPVLHNQRIGRFRLKRAADWNSKFLVVLMNDPRIRRKVIREATGTTVRHTSPDRIRSGFALKPRSDEQNQIVAILERLDFALASAVLEATKLGSLKAALMTDLLTGRVCVPESVFPVETPA